MRTYVTKVATVMIMHKMVNFHHENSVTFRVEFSNSPIFRVHAFHFTSTWPDFSRSLWTAAERWEWGIMRIMFQSFCRTRWRIFGFSVDGVNINVLCDLLFLYCCCWAKFNLPSISLFCLALFGVRWGRKSCCIMIDTLVLRVETLNLGLKLVTKRTQNKNKRSKESTKINFYFFLSENFFYGK